MTPSETRAALTHFYDAFARRDGAAMAGLYDARATFEDPVFRLRGPDIGKMWIALTGRAREFGISYTITRADAGAGTVEWTARYVFSGRPVVNVIVSELELSDGRIVRQRDRFDFPRWAAQALGLPGRLLGRFAWFQRAVSRRIARRLDLSAAPPPV
ncbi:MAG TPA: nuclear transport factor 2 family protein [Thermoanaerobaculia bacterium]|nr:nuclear transport factor 2 family protein [Thermoanaerobaculia bacterium]